MTDKMQMLTVSETLWAMQPEAFAAFSRAFLMGGEGPDARISFPSREKPEEDEGPYELVDGVAVISVEGVLLRKGESFFGVAGQQEIRAALDAALADPACRAVLFSVHSPGGQARGVKELADAIQAAGRTKPCAAYVDGLCASAAYWLASATGRVYAGPSSEVGSIGVILRHMDRSGLNDQIGLKYTYITAGAFKAVGNPDTELSERDRTVLQARVDGIYEMFCGDVASRMGLALENRAEWADGRDFLAVEAEALGLVSRLVTGRGEAIAQLLKETHMDKAELAQAHPELLAQIEREAVEAAGQELSAKVDAAVADVLAIMETACGKESADKVRKLVATGMTPSQLEAAAAVLGSQDRSEKRGEEMLEAIRQATPGAVKDGAALKEPVGFEDLVKACMEKDGCTRGEAIRSVSIRNRDEYKAWLDAAQEKGGKK